MTLEPLLRAPLLVQAHVATVVPAMLLGAWLLVFSRKGLPVRPVRELASARWRREGSRQTAPA